MTSPSVRPRLIVGVAGTATEVGKTWFAARLARSLVDAAPAVRKPVQSFEPGTTATDARLLADASGEAPATVCPPHRAYELAMAPPMAADALGRDRIRLADLVAEIGWPDHAGIGIVETVGGVRSPVAHDGDSVDLLRAVGVDVVVLVSDAGLGVVNAVSTALAVLDGFEVLTVLNRFDPTDDLHRRNRAWLAAGGVDVVTTDEAIARLGARVRGRG